METGVFLMGEAGYASEHDQKVARWVAYILAGGRVTAGSPVSEQYLLDLEREAFLSLCGERKTPGAHRLYAENRQAAAELVMRPMQTQSRFISLRRSHGEAFGDGRRTPLLRCKAVGPASTDRVRPDRRRRPPHPLSHSPSAAQLVSRLAGRDPELAQPAAAA